MLKSLRFNFFRGVKLIDLTSWPYKKLINLQYQQPKKILFQDFIVRKSFTMSLNLKRENI